MADQIAKGSVVISANADPLVKGLKKAASESDNFAKGINQRMQNVMTGFGAGLIGGGLAEVVKKATEGLVMTVNKSHEFEASLARSAQLSGELAQSMERVRGKFTDAVDIAGDNDPVAKIEAINTAIGKFEKELSGARMAAEVSQRRIAELNDALNKESWQLWLGGGLKNNLDAANAGLSEANANVSKISVTLAKLREDRLNTKLPWEDPKNLAASVKGLDELEAKLADVGRTARDSAFMKFTESWPTVEQMAKWNDLYDQLEQRQKHFEIGFVNSQVRSAGILGSILKGAGAAVRGLGGLDLGDLDKTANSASKMFAGAFEKGSGEAFSMDVKNRFGTDTTEAATQKQSLLEQKAIKKGIDQMNRSIDLLNKQLGEAV